MAVWGWLSVPSTTALGDFIGLLNERMKGLEAFVTRLAKWRLNTVTAAETATTIDEVLSVNCTSGAVTVTLPSAREAKGLILMVTKTDATTNAVTITPDGSDTIGSAATWTLAVQNESVILIGNGTSNWLTVAGGAVSALHGGSGLTGATLGDTIYGSATSVWSRLTGNTTATRKFMRQTGTGSVSAAPAWDTLLAADVPASALTKTDDTNVTLTLGGTPASSLLAATSLTLGWTGTLASGRLNANVVQGITNDTNVTGSIATQTLTLGWSGQLAVARGGTAKSGIAAYSTLYASATDTYAELTANTTTTRKFVSMTGTGSAGQAPAWTQIADTDVLMNRVAGSTFSTLRDFFTLYSVGKHGGGVLSDAGSGNVHVTAGYGTIATGPLATDPLVFTDWAAGDLAVPANTLRYVGVKYNSGSPVITIETSENWTYQDSFPLGTVVNEAGTLFVKNNALTIAGMPGALTRRFHQTLPYSRDEIVGGLIVSDSGAQKVAVSAGVLWDRTNSFTITAKDTNVASTFDLYYVTSGTWTKSASQTTWPNLYYNNITTGLVALGVGKYANLWWYVTVSDNLVCLYGRNEYNTVAQAELGTQPTTLPLRLQEGARLIARTTFQKSATAFSAIDSVFNVTFSATGATTHNNLGGLDGGTAGQYFHMTSAEYSGTWAKVWSVTDSTNATSTTTGAVKITGGLGVAMRIYCTDLTVTNAISGSATGLWGA